MGVKKDVSGWSSLIQLVLINLHILASAHVYKVQCVLKQEVIFGPGTKFNNQIEGRSIVRTMAMAYQLSIYTFLRLCPLALLLFTAIIAFTSASVEKCQLPAGVHPILLPFEDEETALMEATCHVACAQKLLSEVRIQTAEIKSSCQVTRS